MKTWLWGLLLTGSLVASCQGVPSQGNMPVVAQSTRYRVVPVLDGLESRHRHIVMQFFS